MGEVRGTVESHDPAVSPKLKIEGLMEQVDDLLTTKKVDLKTEGPAAEGKNRASIGRLETARFHLQRAKAELDAY